MQTFLDSLSLAREKMLDAKFSSAPEPERSHAQRSLFRAVKPRLDLFAVGFVEPDSKENLITLCSACHANVHRR